MTVQDTSASAFACIGMAKVEVTNMTVLDNPTAFKNPFQFEITFECIENLPDGERERELARHFAYTLDTEQHFTYL